MPNHKKNILAGMILVWHTVCSGGLFRVWHTVCSGGPNGAPPLGGVFSFPHVWGGFCGGGGGGINIVSTSYIISQFNSQIPHQYKKKQKHKASVSFESRVSSIFSISSLHSGLRLLS